MVSPVTVILSIVLGLMAYVMVPVVAIAAPVQVRHRIGTFYLQQGARVLQQFTFVRRVLSGYDVLPINVDDEQKLLKVTLTSSMTGDNNEYRFKDPDDRISRLFNKPVALAFEEVPAAIDAELAEWGHWVREKQTETGLWRGDGEDVKADPYVPASDGLRLVDPVDVFELVSNAVTPEHIKTAEQLTKKRYEKYSSGIGLRDTMRMIIAFGVGVASVIALQYVNVKLLDGEAGGVPVVGEETFQVAPDPGLLVDVVVMLA